MYKQLNAFRVNWLALTRDHHLPHSYGYRQALNLEHSKHCLLTRQNLYWLCHWAATEHFNGSKYYIRTLTSSKFVTSHTSNTNNSIRTLTSSKFVTSHTSNTNNFRTIFVIHWLLVPINTDFKAHPDLLLSRLLSNTNLDFHDTFNIICVMCDLI